jgi:type III secretory pathway component EscT
MLNKKIIKKEISLFHFLLLTTSKLLIGIGLGLIIATYYWFIQPCWFLIILAGGIILLLTLYHLMKAEEKKEVKLISKLKK